MPSFVLDNNTSVTTNSNFTGASLLVDYELDSYSVNLSLVNTTGVNPFGANATQASLTGIAFDIPDYLTTRRVHSTDTNTRVSRPGRYWNRYIREDVSFAPFSDNFDYSIGKLPGVGGNVNRFAVRKGDDIDVNVTFYKPTDAETWFNSLRQDDIRFAARFQQVNAGAGSDKLYYVSNALPEPQATPEATSVLAFALLISFSAIVKKFS